ICLTYCGKNDLIEYFSCNLAYFREQLIGLHLVEFVCHHSDLKIWNLQVQPTFLNFFLNVKDDLYLLQIDAKKLGNGLAYEAVGDTNVFPHFYGPSRSFSPLPLDTVIKGEKLVVPDGKFVCSMLS
ncbi:uncharacterized protein, partial [Solanum tuberosum]|uniref:uncharacterized protein n=1 Tax=Solanum tuberosum TaxID=4113 RepID=UPI0003D27933